MQDSRLNFIILFLKIIAFGSCLVFIARHFFYEITPFTFSPTFIISLLLLFSLNFQTKTFQKKNYFKLSHILIIATLLLLVVHLRAGIFWALNTFPLRDVYTVWHTLQEPFDDFAYSMVQQYLIATIPQALIITLILTAFLYLSLGSLKKRLIFIGTYFIASIVFFVKDVPISDYILVFYNESSKNVFFSDFFDKNYVNPDSVKFQVPEHKRNLILIYIESLETSFADKEHGGNQNVNLMPEITEIAQQNINFGKSDNNIGGGIDAVGSSYTFGAMYTRSLGIPHVSNYKDTPRLHNYKSLYTILSDYGYKQIFFQGNPGLYEQFQTFVSNQKIDEIYGPDDLIQRMNLDTADLIKKQGFKTVPDKETFKFANQILDTISEPFSLTFFTIDTHSPSGIYDPDCVKIADENDEDERLKASVRCVSRELKVFIDSLKNKAYYENTSIVIFGDHLFMGTRLVKDFPNRKWIDIFINPAKDSVLEDNRIFSDMDMFPTILSSMSFDIKGDKLGLGTDLFSGKQTLAETISLDTLNREIMNISKHMTYENYLLQQKQAP